MKEKIVILGSGESGVGAAILAVQKHDDVFVSDLGIIPLNTKQKLDELGVAFEEKKHTFDLIKKVILKNAVCLIAYWIAYWIQA